MSVWEFPPCSEREFRATDTVSKPPHLAASHAHSSARFRRPRTRSGVEDRSFAAGDKTLVRAGQCRHRAGGRMRGARYRRPCRGDRFLQNQRGGFRRGRPGNAARGRHRRRSWRGRLQGIRTDQGRGPAGKLEEIHQGAVQRVRHSDRRLWPFHRSRCGEGLHPQTGRADRGQGRRACRRQGRRGGDDDGRSRSRHRHDVRRRVRRGRRRGRDRGVSVRPRDQLFCAVRRRDRDRAGLRAGPQARVRSRPGAEHRRHGRLFADAVRDGGNPRRDHGEDHPADGAPA